MQLYLLSIKELIYETEDVAEKAIRVIQLQQDALKKLDAHRREKVVGINAEMTRIQSIGAGLLLQYAVQTKALDGKGMVELSVSEVLEQLHEPIPIDYVYNIHGKPDFADGSWHFNLSHSGDYVCLVVDEKPVGVDIQQIRPLKNYHVAERFYSETELAKMESCINETEKVECFYDIWVKKESYAKLTGEGIGQTVGVDTEDASLQVDWYDFVCPEGYRLAVCTVKNVES